MRLRKGASSIMQPPSTVLRCLVVAIAATSPAMAGPEAAHRDAPAPRPPVAARPAPAAPAAAVEPAPEPDCDDGAPYDPAALRARAAHLASVELDGRAAGSPGDAAARDYLAERFRCLGLVPGGSDGSYVQPFVADGHPTANLIGYLPGDDAAVGREIIVVGAHHDHLGAGHLGANDNASGSAALLAIAQALHQRGKPRRTIAFIAFGGEELGLLGSAYFTQHPPAALPLERIVYDINLDMVGSYTSAGAVYAMGTFRGLPATSIVKTLAAEHPALHVGIGGRGVGSDHAAFCRAGVPYVFFWTPDRRCYHERCDTVDKLDLPHLSAIAAFAGELAIRLSDLPGDLTAARARLGCGQR
jgi:hypothetical protein